MRNSVLADLTLEFAINVSNLCDNLECNSVLSTQLLRSATSIGANLREALYGQSTADFIHKQQIALKECYETEYWLELLFHTKKISPTTYYSLKNDCGVIRAKLVKSINTTKENNRL